METHSQIDLVERNPAELAEGEKRVTMTTTFTTTTSTIADCSAWKHGEKEQIGVHGPVCGWGEVYLKKGPGELLQNQVVYHGQLRAALGKQDKVKKLCMKHRVYVCGLCRAVRSCESKTCVVALVWPSDQGVPPRQCPLLCITGAGCLFILQVHPPIEHALVFILHPALWCWMGGFNHKYTPKITMDKWPFTDHPKRVWC